MEKDQKLEIDLSGLDIGIAMPCHTGMVPMYTMVGMMETAGILAKLGVSFTFFNNYQHSLVDQARNELAYEFMKSKCNKILWIDSDIAFTADESLRLIALSTLYPMVCGLYPIKGLPDGEEKYFVDFPPEGPMRTKHGLFHIRNTGFGFHIADRAVYESLAETLPKYEKRGTVYTDFFRVGRKDHDTEEGMLKPFGEDYYFFRAAEEKGWHLVMDPTIKIGHVGMKVWRGDPARILNMEDDKGA